MLSPIALATCLILAVASGAAAGEKKTDAKHGATAATQGGGGSATAVVGEAMNAFWEVDYARAETLAQSVAGMPNASRTELADAQKVLACVYTMRKAHHETISSLVRMFQIDQTARFSPDTDYPPPVINSFYTVRDSLFPGTMDINTVAVGDFEDNSVYTGKFKNYDFGALARALPHLITLDLVDAAGLKVVDRQRTADILKEMQLSTSGFADPKQAVQAGKLLGAHAFIFGQYMVLSADKIRIDARVVQTATGEVLSARQITAKFGGKPEVFFDLEKQLIASLMQALSATLGQEAIPDPEKTASEFSSRKSKTLESRPGYVDGMFLTASALQAEENLDYKDAVESWRKVLEIDPGNHVALVRVKLLGQLTQI
jgi:TolB-like protein